MQGIYSYRADFLPKVIDMPVSLLQRAEDLEQNKARRIDDVPSHFRVSAPALLSPWRCSLTACFSQPSVLGRRGREERPAVYESSCMRVLLWDVTAWRRNTH